MEANPQGTSSIPLYDFEVSCAAQHSTALAALRMLRGYDTFLSPTDVPGIMTPLLSTLPTQPPCLPAYCHHLPLRAAGLISPTQCENELRRRGEKRPIPPELKDEKYFERRRRNNQAAKKSRDARRIREDQIAWRACLLEQENASLRAHVSALRQETLALRGLLAAKDEAHTTPNPNPTPTPTSTTKD